MDVVLYSVGLRWDMCIYVWQLGCFVMLKEDWYPISEYYWTEEQHYMHENQ